MSLITRCPACGTMFKVVPDQLRISEGWVRCGHCAEVFDASAHMQAEGTPPPNAAAHLPSPTVQAVQAPQPESPPAPASIPVPVPEQVAEPAAAIPDFRIEPFNPPDDELYAVPGAPRVAEDAEPADAQGYDLPAMEELRAQAVEPAVDAPPMQDVSFVRQARRQAFWRKPAVRGVLALVAVVLVAALALQMTVQERDRIAAAQPALLPLLQQLCGPLQCTVGPPRQIESVVVDGSTFSRLRGDAYRLSFTLRNQAANEIAMPSIELTLTDAQDQPLVRRVLSPADMGAATAALPAGAEWGGNLAMNVTANGAGRIAGYRVLAFYP